LRLAIDSPPKAASKFLLVFALERSIDYPQSIQ
jgi:hypothetical protein